MESEPVHDSLDSNYRFVSCLSEGKQECIFRTLCVSFNYPVLGVAECIEKKGDKKKGKHREGAEKRIFVGFDACRIERRGECSAV